MIIILYYYFFRNHCSISSGKIRYRSQRKIDPYLPNWRTPNPNIECDEFQRFFQTEFENIKHLSFEGIRTKQGHNAYAQ